MAEIQRTAGTDAEQAEKRRRKSIFWRAFWITLLVIGMLAIGFFGSWGLLPLMNR